jgi:hypothetical protein
MFFSLTNICLMLSAISRVLLLAASHTTPSTR